MNKPLKTVEDLHQEWRQKLIKHLYQLDLLLVENATDKELERIKKQLEKCRRMVELIEDHLL